MRLHFFKLSLQILNLFLLLFHRLDDAGACPARSLNEGVRAVRVVYFGNDNPAGRRPLPCCCDIAWLNAPSRAVLKFDDVALLAFLDTHSVPLRFVNAKEKIFRECIGYRMHA